MINVPIVSTYSDKGVKEAEKSFGALNKTVKDLAKSYLTVFTARKVIAFGEASVKAFAADDKAAQVLTKTLENLGMAFASPEVKTFIADMEAQFHVVDDKLRPAFQKLTTVTGDYQLAQKLLKTSLDLSAMSGQDLATTSADIGKAFAGQTRGLVKYQTGLTKAQLAAFSFEEILTQISKVSMGQAELAANTYSGQLEALNIAANNAKETIGKGLVQALTEASAAGDFEGAISNIDKLAGKTFDFIIYVERELQLLAAMPSLVEILTGDVQAFKEFGDAFNKVKALDAQRKPQQYGGIYATKYANEAMESKRKADAAKLAKEKAAELALLKAKNAQTLLDNKMKKDQAALDELKKRFDIERINLQVALAKATDDETKARIRAQIAILDETGSTAQKAMDELDKAQAAKIAQELAAAQALAKLADGATYAAGVLGKIVMPTTGTPSLTPQQIEDELKKGKFVPVVPDSTGTVGGGGNPYNYPSSGFPGADKNPPYMGEPVKPDMFNPDYSKNTGAGFTLPNTNKTTAAPVYIDNSIHVGEGGTIVDTNTITDIVKTAVQQNNRYGSSLQYAGAIAI